MNPLHTHPDWSLLPSEDTWNTPAILTLQEYQDFIEDASIWELYRFQEEKVSVKTPSGDHHRITSKNLEEVTESLQIPFEELLVVVEKGDLFLKGDTRRISRSLPQLVFIWISARQLALIAEEKAHLDKVLDPPSFSKIGVRL